MIKRAATVFLLLAPALACGKKASPPPPAQTAATPAKAPPAIPAAPPRYSHLVHVAGRGELDTDGESFWKPEFEGKLATDVELSRPYSAVADAAGHIYIADKDGHAVRRIERDKTIHTFAGTNTPGDGPDAPSPATTTALREPNGLHLNTGVLYILDLGNGKIRKALPGGAMQTVFRAPRGIDTGRGLWVAPDESRILVASKNELLVREDGDVRVLADGFSSLANLLVEPDGAVVVADRGGDRVHRVMPDGAIFHVAGGGTGEPTPGKPLAATKIRMDGPRGIVRLEDGTLLVATHEGARIFEVDTDGLAHVLYDPNDDSRRAIDPGEVTLQEIRFMTETPSGNLLLVHNNRGIVHEVVASH